MVFPPRHPEIKDVVSGYRHPEALRENQVARHLEYGLAPDLDQPELEQSTETDDRRRGPLRCTSRRLDTSESLFQLDRYREETEVFEPASNRERARRRHNTLLQVASLPVRLP